MSWNDKDWDDYVRGQPYTQFGEIKRQQLRDSQAASATNWRSGGAGSTTNGSMTDTFRALVNLASGAGVVYVLVTSWPGLAWYWLAAGFMCAAVVADWLQKGPLVFLPRFLAAAWYVSVVVVLIGAALYWFGVVG